MKFFSKDSVCSMKQINIYSTIITVFTVVAIISLIIVVLYPAPIKSIIRPWIKSSNYPLSKDAKKHDNYVLYNGRDNDAEQIESIEMHNREDDNAEELPMDEYRRLVRDIRTLNANDTHAKVLSTNRANVVLNVRNATVNVDASSVVDNRHKLIVFFIGGSFLFQDLTSHYGIGNRLYEIMGPENFDVMLVRYPVRFASTLRESMLSINKTLSDVMLRYKEFYAIGYSAGALLASVFIQKELDSRYASKIRVPQIGLSFRKFIGICGLYYPIFMNNKILTRLFKYYILRGTVSADMYTIISSMESIPKLVISNTTDFLYDQTVKFIQTLPNTAYKIYTNTDLHHTFMEHIDLVESKDAFELIRKFVLQKTN